MGLCDNKDFAGYIEITNTDKWNSCPLLNEGAYRGADKALARPTSRCILFHG